MKGEGRIMLKLMKYEFRKQLFSKIVIAVILGVLTLYFGVMCFIDRPDAAAVAVAVMSFSMVIATIYVAIEGISVYSKELDTKQGYLLFMTPQPGCKILGAKLISSIAQGFITVAIYAVVGLLCGMMLIAAYSDYREFLEFIREIMEMSFNIQVDIGSIVRMLVTLFVMWAFILTLGMFVLTLVHTVLNRGKLTSFLCNIGYIVMIFAVIKAYDSISAMSGFFGTYVFLICYYAVISLALYAAASWLIDKKLSV